LLKALKQQKKLFWRILQTITYTDYNKSITILVALGEKKSIPGEFTDAYSVFLYQGGVFLLNDQIL